MVTIEKKFQIFTFNYVSKIVNNKIVFKKQITYSYKKIYLLQEFLISFLSCVKKFFSNKKTLVYFFFDLSIYNSFFFFTKFCFLKNKHPISFFKSRKGFFTGCFLVRNKAGFIIDFKGFSTFLPTSILKKLFVSFPKNKITRLFKIFKFSLKFKKKKLLLSFSVLITRKKKDRFLKKVLKKIIF